MRAALFRRFGGPEVLELADLPEPHAGPGELRIRVRAAGVNASDGAKRRGLMDQELPQTLGYEAAGIVDEVGDGVTGVRAGDAVVGASPYGAAQAALAVLSDWAPVPDGLGFAEAAALPAAAETAARALDQLDVAAGDVLLVNGASGSVGSAAVQLAVLRGARVIGTGSPATHAALRALGAEPVAYGDGMTDRVRDAAPGGREEAPAVRDALAGEAELHARLRRDLVQGVWCRSVAVGRGGSGQGVVQRGHGSSVDLVVSRE